VALPTAFANDVVQELCFAQQVMALGRPGDLVWGLSTSGNSANVNHALRAAKALGLRTLGLTGRNGGAMAALCEVELRVPADKTPLIQELHLPVYHALCAALEDELFSANQG
jgi:D-sedoheptulose 7-phosphate isomerase